MVSANPISHSARAFSVATPCALVTGAASGIGLEFARALAARSENLLLVDRSGGPLRELAEELSDQHQVRTTAYVADLAEPSAPLGLIKHAWREHWRVTTLINSAAIGVRQPLARQPLASIRQEINVNVTAVMGLIRVFLPSMIRRRSGSIINVASVAAFQRVPRMAVYAGSKSFMHSVTESLAVELEGTGIYVAELCPGVTRTPFLDSLGLDPSEIPANAHTAEQVVEAALTAIDRRKRIIIPGLQNKLRVWSELLSPWRAARAARDSVRRLLRAL